MTNRRKTIDFWANLLWYLNVLAWVLLVFMLLIFHRAQPEFETLFDKFYQLELRTDWDIQYLYALIYLVIIGICISLGGLFLGRFRGRRKKDHKTALILTGVVSVMMLGISIIVL